MPYIILFPLRTTLFFWCSKAMWVAIDFRSKIWVAVPKSLGSTDLDNNYLEIRRCSMPP
jgi:hypothetical protein